MNDTQQKFFLHLHLFMAHPTFGVIGQSFYSVILSEVEGSLLFRHAFFPLCIKGVDPSTSLRMTE